MLNVSRNKSPWRLTRNKMAAVPRGDDSHSSTSELDTDEELESEYTRGKLTPGLYKEAAAPKTYVNNMSGLTQKLATLKQELDWLERMDVTCSATPPTAKEGEEGEQNRLDINNDFKREMLFYQQTQEATLVGLKRLRDLDVPTARPDDYFAEMVKTDEHMQRIRKNLLSQQENVVQSEKAKKMRELKKFGKKIQQDILQKRQMEKSKALEAVKKFRKGKGGKPEFLRDLEGEMNGGGEFGVEVEQEEEKRGKTASKGGNRGGGGKSKKREGKNAKFGFGGKKRGMKRNTSASSADMSAFRPSLHSQSSSAKRRKVAAKRPGKARRAKMRQRKGKR